MSGQLCLKWNNHSNAFNKLLQKIYLTDSSGYSDATILCHGKFYPVHRFVLSTCSEYFEEMFQQCIRLNNKHPFIIVKDIHPEQMEALLNYMYKGEVNVPQEQLPELIKSAETFKIKGLAVPDEDEPPSKKKRSASSSSPVPKKSKRSEEKSSRIVHEFCSDQNKVSNKPENDSQENQSNFSETLLSNVKSEPIDDSVDSVEAIQESSSSSLKEESEYKSFETGETYQAFDFDASNDQFENDKETVWEEDLQPFEQGEGSQGDPSNRSGSERELKFGNNETAQVSLIAPGENSQVEQLSQMEGSLYKCYKCQYKTPSKYNLETHFRTHTGEKPFHCNFCSYRAAQKITLERHIKSSHTGEKPFQCPFCPYAATLKASLKSHLIVKHEQFI